MNVTLPESSDVWAAKLVYAWYTSEDDTHFKIFRCKNCGEIACWPYEPLHKPKRKGIRRPICLACARSFESFGLLVFHVNYPPFVPEVNVAEADSWDKKV